MSSYDVYDRDTIVAVSVLSSNRGFVCWEGDHRPAGQLAVATLILFVIGYLLWTWAWAHARIVHVTRATFTGFTAGGASSRRSKEDAKASGSGAPKDDGSAACNLLPDGSAFEFANADAAAAADGGKTAAATAKEVSTTAAPRSWADLNQADDAKVVKMLAARPIAARLGILACGRERTMRWWLATTADAPPALLKRSATPNDAGKAQPTKVTLAVGGKAAVNKATGIGGGALAAARCPLCLRGCCISPPATRNAEGLLLRPAHPGLLVACACDASVPVRLDSGLAHFTGTYRASSLAMRQVDLASLAALAAIQVFMPAPATPSAVTGRATLNIVTLLVVAWYAWSRQPFLAGDDWKMIAKVGSLLLAALAAVLTHYTLSLELAYGQSGSSAADGASSAENGASDSAGNGQPGASGVSGGAGLSGGFVGITGDYERDTGVRVALSHAVFIGAIALLLALAAGFWRSVITGAKAEMKVVAELRRRMQAAKAARKARSAAKAASRARRRAAEAAKGITSSPSVVSSSKLRAAAGGARAAGSTDGATGAAVQPAAADAAPASDSDSFSSSDSDSGSTDSNEDFIAGHGDAVVGHAVNPLRLASRSSFAPLAQASPSVGGSLRVLSTGKVGGAAGGGRGGAAGLAGYAPHGLLLFRGANASMRQVARSGSRRLRAHAQGGDASSSDSDAGGDDDDEGPGGGGGSRKRGASLDYEEGAPPGTVPMSKPASTPTSSRRVVRGRGGGAGAATGGGAGGGAGDEDDDADAAAHREGVATARTARKTFAAIAAVDAFGGAGRRADGRVSFVARSSRVWRTGSAGPIRSMEDLGLDLSSSSSGSSDDSKGSGSDSGSSSSSDSGAASRRSSSGSSDDSSGSSDRSAAKRKSKRRSKRKSKRKQTSAGAKSATLAAKKGSASRGTGGAMGDMMASLHMFTGAAAAVAAMERGDLDGDDTAAAAAAADPEKATSTPLPAPGASTAPEPVLVPSVLIQASPSTATGTAVASAATLTSVVIPPSTDAPVATRDALP